MDTDDLEPIKKPKIIDFDTLSIEELEEYIEELKAAQIKQESLIATMADGAILLNSEGKIVLTNPTAKRLFKPINPMKFLLSLGKNSLCPLQGSPSRGSIFITSAPISLNNIPPNGPDSM